MFIITFFIKNIVFYEAHKCFKLDDFDFCAKKVNTTDLHLKKAQVRKLEHHIGPIRKDF